MLQRYKGNDRNYKKITTHPESTSPPSLNTPEIYIISQGEKENEKEKINKNKDVT